ncbi:endolysin [Arthrobacter phage Emotion]|uniref:N-acetylmuramoyl-L-alanine amidase n=1 Tax=Arthrobacter phage Emotion TaxID=3038361 RepID=A0AA49IJY3_9CAUD|nr:endolysin [Arthrobacter phage Emotion]
MAVKYETKYNSPNYTPASSVPAVYGMARKVEFITIHHWGATGQSHSGVVNYLCRKGGNTSAHYVISGNLATCIVDPDHAAWHAGSAKGNARSIGLELRPEASAADYAGAAEVIADLRAVYGNVPLVPHRHWFATACPGKWDLAKLDKMAKAVTAARKAPAKPAAKPAPKPAAKPAPKPAKKDEGNVKERDVWAYRNPNVEPARDVYKILREAAYWAKKAYVQAKANEAKLDAILARLEK